jgi:hypothetical protein
VFDAFTVFDVVDETLLEAAVRLLFTMAKRRGIYRRIGGRDWRGLVWCGAERMRGGEEEEEETVQTPL